MQCNHIARRYTRTGKKVKRICKLTVYLSFHDMRYSYRGVSVRYEYALCFQKRSVCYRFLFVKYMSLYICHL